MRLRIIPCAIIALLLSSPVLAQYPSDQEAGKTEKQVAKKKISLSKEAVFSDKEASTKKIAGITVVNKLWDTTRLGFLQVGMFNTKAEAVPDKDYNAWFQEFVNEAFANQFQANAPSLLWVIEDLRIGERTGGMSEKAFTRLKATAYLATGGNRYKLLAASDEATQNGGMDVTHKHKNNIAKAFKQFYLLSLSKIDSVLSDQQGATFSYDDVIASFDRKRAIPVLTQPVKDGIYLSFLDFRENKPSITNFEIAQTKGAVVTAIEADGSKRRIADYWGVVKNGEIYKYYKKRLLPLDKDGYGFTISSYVADYRRKNNAVMIGAVVGGVAGGLISESSNRLAKVDAFPHLAEPEATAIDMETGDLIF